MEKLSLSKSVVYSVKMVQDLVQVSYNLTNGETAIVRDKIVDRIRLSGRVMASVVDSKVDQCVVSCLVRSRY